MFQEADFQRDQNNLGFFGKPNIGNAVIQASILKEADIAANDLDRATTYTQLVQEMTNELNHDQVVYIFCVGSVFGGTGASAIPTIAKDLNHRLQEYRNAHQNVGTFYIGAALLLPYMNIPQYANEAYNLVRNNAFNTGAKCAMTYYHHNMPTIFKRIYPIGLPFPYTVQPPADNEIHFGSVNQVDPSNIVEWVAAMACQDFVAYINGGNNDNVSLPCAGLTPAQTPTTYTLDERSFMNPDFAPAFCRWSRFTAFYLTYLYPGIRCGRENKNPGNWYENHLSNDANRAAEDDMYAFLTRFCNALNELSGEYDANLASRPTNMLFDRDALNTLLRNQTTDWRKPQGVFAQSQKDTNKCLMLSKIGLKGKAVKSADLQKVISTKRTTTTGFAGMIELVNQYLVK